MPPSHNGGHPNLPLLVESAEGRRLVFVGDLVDRRPNSPAVLELVMELVKSGRAQCILGNQELSLLRHAEKDGNEWYTNPRKKLEFPARRATPALKRRARAFLATLPLALERDDLRVVHACWNEAALRRVRQAERSGLSALALYEAAKRTMESRWNTPAKEQQLEAERQEHSLTHRKSPPPFMPLRARKDTDEQMKNPVAVLTSGEEQPAEAPFWAGDKWRMVRRVAWWDRYADPTPVIVGHYWRQFRRTAARYVDKDGPELFAGIEAHHWFGQRRNVYCVDFSIGARYRERKGRKRSARKRRFVCRLAAVRVPEWEVVHDGGHSRYIGPPLQISFIAR